MNSFEFVRSILTDVLGVNEVIRANQPFEIPKDKTLATLTLSSYRDKSLWGQTTTGGDTVYTPSQQIISVNIYSYKIDGLDGIRSGVNAAFNSQYTSNLSYKENIASCRLVGDIRDLSYIEEADYLQRIYFDVMLMLMIKTTLSSNYYDKFRIEVINGNH